MVNENRKYRIKITKDGPYLVSGNIPLSEKIITPKGREYELKAGRQLPQAETYALCRCGGSKNPPFCDGSHSENGFYGEETASRKPYRERAELLVGPGIDLLDDNRCAFARFCHRKPGNAWNLANHSDTDAIRDEAIRAASDCPTGRLTAVGKDGVLIEPELDPAIAIIQDPEKGVSSGLYVQGGILIEAADGFEYEVRNRTMLCRCGKSHNKPFCDATHVVAKYLDHK